MMYAFMQLEDDTEIVHSDYMEDNEKGEVKVYVEKPVENGFHYGTCWLPSYTWEDVYGFNQEDVDKYQEIIESTAHLMIGFSKERGFEHASNF